MQPIYQKLESVAATHSHYALVLALYFAFGLFELHFPAEPGQGIWTRWRNMAYGFILLIAGGAVVGFLFSLIPFPPYYLPPRGIGFSLFVLGIYVFFTDFVFYWYHRAQHSLRALWAIHELHHSDTELNATTSMRTYWIELPVQTLLTMIPIQFLFGIDATALALLPVVLTLWLFFTHANLRLRLGFLTPFLCGPQLHRIHHSNLPEHANKNFAQFLPVFDVLFGTYYGPKHDEFPTTGVASLASDTPLHVSLLRPFKLWLKALKKP